MAAWGVKPAEVATTFSEEALIELVPALYERRMRESIAYAMPNALEGLRAHESGAAPAQPANGGVRTHKYASGRTGRTYGSPQRPLTGAAMEAAIRDAGKRYGSGRRPS